MKLISQNIIFSSVRKAYELLPDKFRVRAAIVMALLFINSLLDLLGLASIIPLFTILLKDGIVQTNYYLNSIYTTLGFKTEENFILFLAAMIVIIIIVKNMVSLLIYYYQSRFAFSLYKHYATSLHQYYYRQGYTFLKNNNSNDIVRNISVTTFFYVIYFVVALLTIMNELLILTFVVIALLIYDAKVIGLLAIVIFPAFLLFYNFVKNRIKTIQEDEHFLDSEIRKTLYQSIFGYSDVEINNNSEWFFNIYDKQVKQKASNQSWIYTYNQAPFKVIESAVIMGVVVVVIYGLYNLNSKTDLIILLGGLAVAAYRVLPSINRILGATMSVKGVQYTFDIVGKIKELEDEEKKPNIPMAFDKDIAFNELTYRYESGADPVLDKISFKIKKGESIGIIGRSGSGKTTLVKILMRFLIENEGSIEIDGVKITEDNKEALRDLMGYVQQEVFILDGTIGDNIAFGVTDDKIDRDLLNKVVESSSLSKVIEQLPDGLDTQIGERGSQLSGGQRQRIGIARSLYTGAQILIFDEATSALDSGTEKEITEAISALKDQDLTMIIVAHRISTLKYCDRIIEIENGRVKDIHQYSNLTH